MSTLEKQLAASLDYVRESRRQTSDLEAWMEATPAPPVRAKALQRKAKKMTENGTVVVVHRDVSGPLEFTPVQQQMIRDTYANGADVKEFQVLMEIAKVRRLNPLLRQVHFVKRWDNVRSKEVWSVQASVDGLRAIAERTGKYDGQDEPEYEVDAKGGITSCKVKVYRKDWSRPAVGVAYWSEYVQTKKGGEVTRFWASMPRVMLAKCAEAIAMRKAFPEDMGGLYVDEEMQQAENDRPAQLQQISAHHGPDESPDAPGDADLFRDLCARFVRLESDLEACDSWEKANVLRGVLGTRVIQSDLTRTMQQKAESGDISPSQRAELGKTWMRANRKLEKLETKLRPALEASFDDGPDGTEVLGAREPGDDSNEL